MSEPVWLTVDLVIAFHDEQLRKFGGPSGLRDRGALEAALDRPRNKWSYGETDLATLAAAYAFGVSRGHPFVDGNKRASFLALTVFLGLNGRRFHVSQPEAAAAILALAAGELSEDALAQWVRDRMG
jgi:death on curing protein